MDRGPKLTRRKFLEGLGSIFSVGAMTGLTGFSLLDKQKNFFTKENLKGYEEILVSKIESTFGVQVNLGNKGKPWSVGGYELHEEESSAVRCLILEETMNELYMYPKDFLKTHVKRINLAGKIKDSLLPPDVVVLGGYNKLDDEMAITKPTFLWDTDNTLLNNLAVYHKFLRGSDFRKTIHHEVGHAYTLNPTNTLKVHLNDELQSFSLHVGEELSHMKDEGLSDIVDFRKNERVTLYGGTNELEDVAEILGIMFAKPKEIEKLQRGNTLLIAKVRVLKKYLFKISGGRINPKYWEDLRNGKVDRRYFYTDH